MGTLIDIQVRFDFAVLKEYLLERNGLCRDVLSFFGALFLCVAASGLQLALPSALPELPCHPAVLVSCYLFHGRLSGVWPVLCGFLLDCWTYGTLGVSSLFLTLCAVLHLWICQVLASRRSSAVFTLGLANFAATLCWTLLMLFFKTDGMSFVKCLALIPRQVLLASLLAVPLGSLLHFKKDGC